jgi:hypothetical protein
MCGAKDFHILNSLLGESIKMFIGLVGKIRVETAATTHPNRIMHVNFSFFFLPYYAYIRVVQAQTVN